MTTVDRLLDLATAYAHAAVRADRNRAAARSAASPTEKAATTSTLEAADAAVDNARAALRADLHQALELPVRALPDTELPVCTWHTGEVLIRALTSNGERVVRVRYTPAQALATGTALIACAAITDQRLGGTLSSILGDFPPTAPTTETGGADTPEAGSRS
ncbi:hypothetical protein QLQ12_21460 [Actinoplanes sp. NEAU-A12]|uniref:Uncharacterized protein n=1 Tax=Actinoplanes sandaracinus TaxID=3045177 RepID=A0ABT6WN57_9ACTN|nr:hypothetical protein [Actinoplanes sandaracinus]MDI6101186.1 hypothetical protein [Actinoplanes sandaracinus]